MDNEKIILGIDPGTNIMGYGLISCHGKNISLITMGVLKLSGLSNHALKLKKIFDKVLSIIDEYHPDELAIEAPFYGKNVQSMLKLGRAQGVAMASALYRDIPITEYSPRRIKQSITGRGAASKEQVAAMLENLVRFQEVPEYLDATDGLAVAVCHSFQGSTASSGNKYGSWKSFLNNNPDRISE
ncbi:MAG: crossover junction endodeoxyribonuclease RuvC [Bacteroidales bacterium]|nr:crossover junction endodeoxyribonuclease RuvC [Bacteroidales bacterium]MCF8327190.1 crossover junction endodeoxyribonuclease RuvC [Bacteroidales bacterium]